MNSVLNQISSTRVFREYTDKFCETYEIRAHDDNEQYLYAGFSNSFFDLFDLYNTNYPDPIKTNGDIHGFWRYHHKSVISKLSFFRIHKGSSVCSCLKYSDACIHQISFETIKDLLEHVGIHENPEFAMNVLSFLI